MDCDFFYETVAPLLLVGVTSLICISTLTSDIKSVSRFPCPTHPNKAPVHSFYTRLFKIKDPITSLPVFSQLQALFVLKLDFVANSNCEAVR